MKALNGGRVGQLCTRFLHRLRTSIPLKVFKRGTYMYVDWYPIVVYISSFLGKKATILRIRHSRSNNFVYLLLFTCNSHSVITKTHIDNQNSIKSNASALTSIEKVRQGKKVNHRRQWLAVKKISLQGYKICFYGIHICPW